jgi:Type II site-specific deoxyribonuclease
MPAPGIPSEIEQRIALDLVDQIRASLSRPASYRIHDKSIFSEEDIIYIAKRIQLHHSVNDEPINKESFEYLMVSVFERAGISALKIERRDNPGEDICSGEEKGSLKTESGKNIKANQLHITKFMECAWQKDYTTREDYLRDAIPRILAHVSNYSRILSLRYLPSSSSYQLVEIPKSQITWVSQADITNLSERTQRGGITLYSQPGQTRLVRFRFDGSDDKLMLTGIKLSDCILHAEILGGNHR